MQTPILVSFLALLAIGTSFGQLAGPWTGPFQLKGQCDTTKCCCTTGNVVGIRQGQNLILVAGASPSCGRSYSVIIIPYPSGNSYTARAANGESVTWAVSADGKSLTIVNSPASYCNDAGSLTAASRAAGGSLSNGSI